MAPVRDAVAIAAEMIAAHGVAAADLADQRAVEHMRCNEPENAALWLRVGRAVRALLADAPRAAGARDIALPDGTESQAVLPPERYPSEPS